MEHKESAVKIYYTKEYARFSNILGNRELNEAKIRRIKRDIDDGLDVLRYCPIMVNERDGKLKIVDGQHRFAVAEEIGSSVWYIISEDITLMEIAKMNSNSEHWKDKDFINCYMQQGNEHYRTIQDFQDESGLPLGVVLQLLQHGKVKKDSGASQHARDEFRAGKFQVTHLEEAQALLKILRLFEAFPGYRSRGFVEAVGVIMDAGKVEIRDIARKFNEDPKQLAKQANGKEYLNAIEVMFNQGAHRRKIIY